MKLTDDLMEEDPNSLKNIFSYLCTFYFFYHLKMRFEIKSLDTIRLAAHDFLSQTEGKTVFAFNGEMGAGKTTFIKALCDELGVTDTVNSPTFAIVNEYERPNGQAIFHFDCYRLKNLQEALDLGTEEYLYSGNLCFIEWAENIAPLLPAEITTVNITVNENGKRTIEVI